MCLRTLPSLAQEKQKNATLRHTKKAAMCTLHNNIASLWHKAHPTFFLLSFPLRCKIFLCLFFLFSYFPPPQINLSREIMSKACVHTVLNSKWWFSHKKELFKKRIPYTLLAPFYLSSCLHSHNIIFLWDSPFTGFIPNIKKSSHHTTA